MPRLIPCPSCHSHVIVGDLECPSCGTEVRTTTAPRVAGVLALGLALAGCPGDDSTTTSVGEPEYGVPATSTSTTGMPATETGTTDAATSTSSGGGGVEYGTADAGIDTSDTTGTDTDGTSGGTATAGEPEYGVPATTTSG